MSRGPDPAGRNKNRGSLIIKKTRLHFTNSRGLQLVGTCVYPKTLPRGWALFANCFTCTKDFKSGKWLAEALASHGIGVMLYDPTGLGESQGEFAESNFSTMKDDLLAAADWMNRHHHSPTLQIGHSIGGLVSLATAPEITSVKAVVTIATPSNLEDIRQRMIRQAPRLLTAGEGVIRFGERPYRVKKQLLDDFAKVDVGDLVRGLEKPLLILHSPADEILLFDHAEALFALAKGPKRIDSLPDFPHLPLERGQLKILADLIADWAGAFLETGPKLEKV